MKLLFEHFELLADAPNSVPKLRELILQLAVQGKLVPQDPHDEPAGELLKRIQAEKERLIAEGKIKKEKPLPPVSEEEIPYELPEGWMWVRLPEIYYDWGQKKPDSKFTYIDVSAIDKENGRISENIEIIEANDAPSRARKIVQNGTVIYSTVRPYLLNIAIVDKDFNPPPIVSTAFAVMHPFNLVQNKYLYFYLRSNTFTEFVESKMVGMAYPAINDTQLRMGIFPLPPFPEQNRIVAKVEQLMAFCDELEQKQAQRSQKRIHLHNAALNRLLTAAQPGEFREHWQRIVSNFELLYDAPETVAQLKQAILQLAMQGKLVKQNPADEPAGELLKRIRAEKERLIAEGKIKKEKPLPAVSAEEIPYTLPEGWVWGRLGDLCELITKGSSPRWQGINYVDKNGLLFITSKNVGSYKLITENLSYVEWRFNEIEPRSILKKGDILMNLVGASIGRTAIYDLEYIANINQAVSLIRLIENVPLSKTYLLHFFNSPISIDFMFKNQVESARANLSLTNVNRFLIPLAPILEQNRIVAKVEELLNLCNALKEQLTRARQKSEQLMAAAAQEIVGK